MAAAARFSAGELECTVVADGWNDYEAAVIFAGVPEEQWRAAAGPSLTDEGMIRLSYHTLLVRLGERLALLDAGLGDFAGPDGSAGKLRSSLEEEGIAPGDISAVLVSHAHPDHIGGLVRMETGSPEPAFPNARVVMWREEFEFWTSEASAAMPDMMREMPAMILPALSEAGVVDLVDDDREVFPGVRMVPAPGHTPGHVAFALSDGEGGAVYLGDTLIHPAQFENPEWTSAVDADPKTTVASRRRLLDDAATRGLLLAAFHLPAPGRVAAGGNGYSFQPSDTN